MTASTSTPPTPPHRCDGCLQKSQSIAELERRISDLYWIRDEEKLLDSVITLGAGPPVDAAKLDSTIPATDAAPPVPGKAATAFASQLVAGPGGAIAPAGQVASVPQSHLQPDDHWFLLGAKPKLLPAAALDFTPDPRRRALSSTLWHQPWQSVADDRKGRRTSPQPPCEIQLSNRYDILSLQDFPPLRAQSSSPPEPPGRGSHQPRSRGLHLQPGRVSTPPTPGPIPSPTHLQPACGATRPAAGRPDLDGQAGT